MVASRQNALATFKLISCKIADGTISPDGATAERDELIAKYGYTTGKRTHTDIPTDAPATKTQKMSAKTGVTKCTVVDGTPAKPNKKMLAAPTSTSTSTSTAASSFTVPASGLHEAFEAIADGSLQLDECDFEESQTDKCLIRRLEPLLQGNGIPTCRVKHVIDAAAGHASIPAAAVPSSSPAPPPPPLPPPPPRS
eukprot:9465743-Pyramimonas_sp.AAC.1